MWEITIEKLKWGFFCSGVSVNVVQEFCKRKVLNPVVQPIVAEHAQVLLQLLVELFGLAIYFQMISYIESGDNIKLFVYGLHDLAGKLGATICDKLVPKAKVSVVWLSSRSTGLSEVTVFQHGVTTTVLVERSTTQ